MRPSNPFMQQAGSSSGVSTLGLRYSIVISPCGMEWNPITSAGVDSIPCTILLYWSRENAGQLHCMDGWITWTKVSLSGHNEGNTEHMQQATGNNISGGVSQAQASRACGCHRLAQTI